MPRSLIHCLVIYYFQYITVPIQLTGSTIISGSSVRFNEFSKFILESQQNIIHQLENEDGKATFSQDEWQKGDSGFGITAVLKGGNFLEKAACSSTIVTGILSDERAKAISSRGHKDMKNAVGKPYFAAALSLVLHSKSPMVPTFRSDVRYFELGDGVGWFGGGADLTPYYLFDEDAIEFHKKYKEICNINGKKDVTYNICKQWCDDYFYLPARKEHRGIGGIFFDDLSSISSFSLPINRINMTDNNVQNKIINGNNIDIINKNEIENENDPTNMNTEIEKIKIDNDIDNDNDDLTKQITESELNEAMTFTKAVCDNFMPSYLPIVRKRKNISHSEEERYWQLLRRGRYIEFNLLYDRGVKFGLVPGGRIEAVMVSCPPLVAWEYNHIPQEGSEEERLMKILKNPIDWCK